MIPMKGIIRAAFGVAGAAALAEVIEKQLIAAPHYRGPESDHFDGKRFFNAESGEHGRDAFLKWMLNRDHGYWREWVDDAPGEKPPERGGGGGRRVRSTNNRPPRRQRANVNKL